MKLEVLNNDQRILVSRFERLFPSNDPLVILLSDLTDRLSAEQLRRESAEEVIEACFDGSMLSHESAAACLAHRKLYPKDSKDINNG